MPSRPRRSGFTLMELMVAVMLSMMLTGAITFIAVQAQTFHTETTAKVELFQKVSFALGILEDELGRMIPTSDLEYFSDSQTDPKKRNRHWDPSEGIKDRGNLKTNLGGGFPGQNGRPTYASTPRSSSP